MRPLHEMRKGTHDEEVWFVHVNMSACLFHVQNYWMDFDAQSMSDEFNIDTYWFSVTTTLHEAQVDVLSVI
jgi:hypothetical protein